MPPETNEPVGQEPTQSQTGQEPGRDYDKEIADLRSEAAKWRSQLREAQGQLKEYEPMVQKFNELEQANKSEAEKLAERLAALEGQLTQANANAELAQKAQRLTVLATKAGVPADTLQYLDVNKFDLENEDSVIEALSALAPAKTANSGKVANPARSNGNSQEDVKAWYEGRGQTNYIFGEK